MIRKLSVSFMLIGLLSGCGDWLKVAVVPGIRNLQGETGEDGLKCWDFNGNGDCDGTEDWNGPDSTPDGTCDAWDCQGAVGPRGPDGNVGETGGTGPRGDPGIDSDPGTDGSPGVPGTSGSVGPVGPSGQDGEDGKDGEDCDCVDWCHYHEINDSGNPHEAETGPPIPCDGG